MTGSGLYAERKSKAAGVTVTRSPTVRIGMFAGVVRMLVLIALPVVVAVVSLLAGADIGSGKWVSGRTLLIAVSWLATLAWPTGPDCRRRSCRSDEARARIQKRIGGVADGSSEAGSRSGPGAGSADRGGAGSGASVTTE
jgi:hypothetical protein